MLSPGQWHKHVPKEPVANVQFRRKLLLHARTDPVFRQGIKLICRQDILFFVLAFVWQFNPRKKKKGEQEVGPFITWDFQETAIRSILDHIEEDRDLLIEKSREMGASWLCLIVMMWFCLFHKNKKFLCISHSEQAVDRSGDPDSLFWKLDFMHKHLPGWLHGGVQKLKLRFRYKETASQITGAATSERSGVGGRATAVFLDEFSKQKDDDAILGQTADVGCRIFNGTHYGLGSAFFRLTQRPDMHKLLMHWSQHPDKKKGLYRVTRGSVDVLDKSFSFPREHSFVLDGSPTGGPFPGLRSLWYDVECRRRGNQRDVAMHLDIDPQGSVSQVFDPLMIRVLEETYCKPCLWQGDLLVDMDAGKPVRLLPSPAGPLKLWINPKNDGTLPGRLYAMGGDISTGVGSSPSILTIGNAETGELVGIYANAHVKPAEFGSIAVALCWLFGTGEGDGARFCWEHSGPGVTFGKRVFEELCYRNVYYRTPEVSGLKIKQADTPGWVPQPKSKDDVLRQIMGALYAHQFVCFDKDTLEEFLHFKYGLSGFMEHGMQDTKVDLERARVNHADRAIAASLMWKMVQDIGQLGRRKEKVVAGQVADVLTYEGRRARYEDERRLASSW